MKKTVLLLFFLFSLFLAAEELLPNGNFSELTGAGLPAGWDIRGKTSCFKPGKDSLTFGGDDTQNLMAIRWHLPLKPGKTYQVSFRSAGEAQFRCYIEWSFMKEGKKQLKAAGSLWRTAAPEGKEESYIFTLPADAQDPYLVLNTHSAKLVTISALRITETTPAAAQEKNVVELLPNADFKILRPDGLPQFWGIRGDKSAFRFGQDSVTITGQQVWLTAGRLPLIGRKGKLSFRVQGEGEYRVYVEYYTEENGKKGSKATSTAYLPAPAAETGRTIEFSVPLSAYAVTLAVTVKSETGVTFSHFRIVADKEEQQELTKGTETKIPLPQLLPGQRYRLTYQAKGEGDSGDTTGYHHFVFRIRGAADGKELYREDTWSNSFQKKSLEFVTASGQPELTAFSETGGKVLLRELSCQAVADPIPPERIVLTTPAFRGMFFSSHQENAVTGYVIAGKSVTSGKAEIGPHCCELQEEGDRWRFTLPRATGKLIITLQQKQGDKPLILTRQIAEAPAAAHEVVISGNGRILCDGKPFYPVAFWNLDGGDAVHAAARCGINAARFHCTTQEKLLAALEECRKNNMMLIAALPNFPKEDSADAFHLWQHRVENLLSREVREHPALLGYFMVDEPRWSGYPLVLMGRAYAFLVKFDPFHPVWINAAPRGTVDELRPYAACCDIFGVDIYPVPQPNTHSHLEDRTMSCVGKYVHWCDEITDNAKPVWMALQGFSWAQLKGDSALSGYPTRHQTRFMIYDAVINGAGGLTWWGLYSVTQPQFYRDLLAETAEFQRYTGALLSAVPSPTVRNGAVESRLWSGEGWQLEITANTSDKTEADLAPYEVRIRVTGQLPAPLWQPPESRPDIKGIEPLTGNMDRKRESRPYAGAPGLSWIWDGALLNTPGSAIWARHTFELKAAPVKALLRFCADDIVLTVRIDGKEAGKIEGHAYMEECDVTSLLSPGKHTILFCAADKGGLPCGLLAEMEMTFDDGSVKRIVTGKTFETAPSAEGPWNPASAVQPYGGSPWGQIRILGK